MCTILQSSLDIVEKGLIDFIQINSVPLQYAVPEILYFDHPVAIYVPLFFFQDILVIYGIFINEDTMDMSKFFRI